MLLSGHFNYLRADFSLLSQRKDEDCMSYLGREFEEGKRLGETSAKVRNTQGKTQYCSRCLTLIVDRSEYLRLMTILLVLAIFCF